MRLVILGKQGAGKGTQAERLAQRFGVPRISTGDMFRTVVKADTEVGRRAKKYMLAGDLVPDDVVNDMVRERLTEMDATDRGFIVEGFPRNVAQAEALDEMLSPNHVDLVIELDVPTGVVLKRLASRRVCGVCGRNYSTDSPPKVDWTCDQCGGPVVQRRDDTEAAISRRLEHYDKQTAPLVAWYLATDRLAAVDGEGHPDIVTRRLLRAVESRLARR
ncbi:MAG TPA: adenylate kinase [Acidimicrobiales bacterium]|jgi:adenylate kinase|nr:adenylate kinase [Acidimicrobiales bacterium]